MYLNVYIFIKMTNDTYRKFAADIYIKKKKKNLKIMRTILI